MAVLPVCTWGHPILKTRAKEVHEVTDEVCSLVNDMFDTMRAQQGVGLAANQVGVAQRLFVVDVPTAAGAVQSQVLINPVVTYKSKAKQTQDEGCLSFPQIFGPVERALEVEVQGKDAKGRPVTVRGSGLLARAFQHELDHLDGIVFIERMNIVHRLRLNKTLKELARRTKAAIAEKKTKLF
ncbi:peptide deformylase [candidate division FCPU426 bacterium]|nr:peptide deformylase [candidate division FCPU426 bacterium]